MYVSKGFKFYLLLTIIFFLPSCEKKVVEIIQVMEIEKDISIPNVSTISSFSFPNEKIGYAVTEKGLFKTVNEGSSWVNILESISLKEVYFFDELNGMCSWGKTIYITHDGGESWSKKSFYDFIGITENHTGVLGKCNESFCDIEVTYDSGKSFEYLDRIKYPSYYDIIFTKVTGTKIEIFTGRSGLTEDMVVLDLETGEVNGYYNIPKFTDVIDKNDLFVAVGKEGLITTLKGFSITEYNLHDNDYNSIDELNGFIICVGNKYITTNLEIGNGDRWNDVLDVNGKSLEQNFNIVKLIRDRTFHISGDSGLFLKARI